jgi:hypothetical protein
MDTHQETKTQLRLVPFFSPLMPFLSQGTERRVTTSFRCQPSPQDRHPPFSLPSNGPVQGEKVIQLGNQGLKSPLPLVLSTEGKGGKTASTIPPAPTPYLHPRSANPSTDLDPPFLGIPLSPQPKLVWTNWGQALTSLAVLASSDTHQGEHRGHVFLLASVRLTIGLGTGCFL